MRINVFGDWLNFIDQEVAEILGLRCEITSLVLELYNFVMQSWNYILQTDVIRQPI